MRTLLHYLRDELGLSDPVHGLRVVMGFLAAVAILAALYGLIDLATQI